jgi:LytS/YehU family sensor histidine kinase
MLARLGDLLRLTLERQLAHEVPLARELELLDLYLEIERARFPDRLTVSIDAPPEVRAALVPTFMLQPIVENAIRHGIAPFSEPGTVRITASRDGDQLALQVADTGPGFGSARPGSGVGLANTRARLRQLYSGAASLATGNAGAGGAVVTARLPWRSEPAFAGVSHG